MEFNITQKKIIQNGISNLREYGFTEANEENILVDFVYSQFFERVLKENLGLGFDDDIQKMLNFISDNRKEFGK